MDMHFPQSFHILSFCVNNSSTYFVLTIAAPIPSSVQDLTSQFGFQPRCASVCVCMRGSHCCIVACAHLANGTGRRTATMMATLLITSGPVRIEAVLHSCGRSPNGEGVGTNL